MRALGIDAGVSKFEVSRICGELDEHVGAFRDRSLSHAGFPYLSDAHEGLKSAIAAVMIGAGWQRCRVHFMRNVLAKVPKCSAEMVAAAIRTIFAQPDAEAVAEQLGSIADKLGRQFPLWRRC